jgi:putative oxidoreductase
MLQQQLKAWAPIPLRVALGVGLMYHGGIKLFAPGGHENIAYLIDRLGVPFPGMMAWVVGAVEFLGGAGIFLGALIVIAAGANALNVGGLLLLAWWAGGIPAPLPGGDPLPEMREALLMLAACLTLGLGGAGRWSISSGPDRT